MEAEGGALKSFGNNLWCLSLLARSSSHLLNSMRIVCSMRVVRVTSPGLECGRLRKGQGGICESGSEQAESVSLGPIGWAALWAGGGALRGGGGGLEVCAGSVHWGIEMGLVGLVQLKLVELGVKAKAQVGRVGMSVAAALGAVPAASWTTDLGPSGPAVIMFGPGGLLGHPDLPSGG